MLDSKLARGIVTVMNTVHLTGMALGASVFLLAVAGPASADRMRRAPVDPAYPHITSQSEYYPADTVTGAVRRGPRGDEVRLPGGTWVPCSFNCTFTLRNATIDFWRRYDVFPQ
jgi:hypothetical protein